MATQLSEIQVHFCLSGAGWGHDYCAHVGDYDLDDPIGWGTTPDAAYWDLIYSICDDLEPDENPGYRLFDCRRDIRYK